MCLRVRPQTDANDGGGLIMPLCMSPRKSLLRDRTGWLSKQGEINPAFKRRWFVASVRDVTLAYFEDEQADASRKKGQIALGGAVVKRGYEAPGRLTVAVAGQARVYVLEAASDEEAEAWVQAMCAMGATHDGPMEPAQKPTSLVKKMSFWLPATAAEKGVKHGWLSKRGDFNPAFKRRWFVLRDGTLTYFETREAKEVDQKGEVAIDGATVHSAFGLGRFHLSVPGRTYVLEAGTDDEARAWVQALWEAGAKPDESAEELLRSLDGDGDGDGGGGGGGGGGLIGGLLDKARHALLLDKLSRLSTEAVEAIILEVAERFPERALRLAQALPDVRAATRTNQALTAHVLQTPSLPLLSTCARACGWRRAARCTASSCGSYARAAPRASPWCSRSFPTSSRAS